MPLLQTDSKVITSIHTQHTVQYNTMSTFEFPPLQTFATKVALERQKVALLEQEQLHREKEKTLKADIQRRYTLYVKKSVLSDASNITSISSPPLSEDEFATKKSAIHKKYKLSSYRIFFEKCGHNYYPVVGSYQERMCKRSLDVTIVRNFTSGCQYCAKTMRTPVHTVPGFEAIQCELEYKSSMPGQSLRSRASCLGYTVCDKWDQKSEGFLRCYDAFYAFLFTEKLCLDFCSFFEVVTLSKTGEEVVAAISARLSAYSNRPALVEDFYIPKVKH